MHVHRFKQSIDSVFHRIVVNDLEYNSIREKAWKYFESYSLGKMQNVRVVTATSENLTNAYGVPQGTILRPVLLYLFKWLFLVKCQCDIIGYALDSAMLYKRKMG